MVGAGGGPHVRSSVTSGVRLSERWVGVSSDDGAASRFARRTCAAAPPACGTYPTASGPEPANLDDSLSSTVGFPTPGAGGLSPSLLPPPLPHGEALPSYNPPRASPQLVGHPSASVSHEDGVPATSVLAWPVRRTSPGSPLEGLPKDFKQSLMEAEAVPEADALHPKPCPLLVSLELGSLTLLGRFSPSGEAEAKPSLWEWKSRAGRAVSGAGRRTRSASLSALSVAVSFFRKEWGRG